MSSKKSRISDNEDRLAFGARLRASRERLGEGHTGEWLARELGQTQPAVSQWETGKRMPEPRTILKMSQVLGCDFLWLLLGDEVVRAMQAADRQGIYVRVSQPPDPRLGIAIENLSDIMRGLPEIEIEWILGNLHVFGDRAREQIRVRGEAEARRLIS